MAEYVDKWYEKALSKCPICGKEFSVAPEHYWKISRFRQKGYDMVRGDYRDTPVCSYTCMRKWEKEQEKKSHFVKEINGGKARFNFTPKQLTYIVEHMPNDEYKKLVQAYYGDRLSITTIANVLGYATLKSVRNKMIIINRHIRNMKELPRD